MVRIITNPKSEHQSSTFFITFFLCALILFKISALYKSFTYLLTYTPVFVSPDFLSELLEITTVCPLSIMV